MVQLLWEETHDQKAVGLNPSTVYWMGIFSLFCGKIVMFVFINGRQASLKLKFSVALAQWVLVDF